MNTVELSCSIHASKDERQRLSDILVAQLALIGFNGFVDNDEGLKAYISENDFNIDDVKDLSIVTMNTNLIDISYKIIQEQNWNETWEKSFKPVIVEEKCIVRAPFHKPEKQYPYDIIIEPKMSFGTGHHATTYLMIKEALELNFNKKTVVDMGSGTGILAILAEKKDAAKILAIDNNEWAYRNCRENINLNKTKKITPILGDRKNLLQEKADIILANINKNVLMEDIPYYANILNNNGFLVVSGIYKKDMHDITEKAKHAGLKYVHHDEKNEWVSIQFQKN
jgi:ribosomal protein L11 methyltransferase